MDKNTYDRIRKDEKKKRETRKINLAKIFEGIKKTYVRPPKK